MWPSNQHCGATFEDLFEPIFVSRVAYRNKLVLRINEHKNTAVPQIPKLDNDIIVFDSCYSPFNLEDIRSAGTSYIQVVLNTLKPKTEIIEEVERLTSRFVKPTVGVHIRLGDFHQEKRVIPIERYINAVKKIKNQLGLEPQCYVASDGKNEELVPFLSRFRCIKGNFYAPKDTIKGVREALIDLLVLARTDFIVQSPLSSFGNVAAFLGKVNSIQA